MKVTPADVAALQRLADDTADELRELEAERARFPVDSTSADRGR